MAFPIQISDFLCYTSSLVPAESCGEKKGISREEVSEIPICQHYQIYKIMRPKNRIHNNVENVKGKSKVVHVVTSAPPLEDFLRSEGIAPYAFLPSAVGT
jgi:hypothetical protein